MEYGELERHIVCALGGSEKLAPAYVVYGNDDYLRSHAVKMLKDIAEEDFASFNVSVFSSDGEVGDAIDVLNTYPVFGEYRVVVLTVAQKFSDADKDALKGYVAAPLQSSVLVVDCESADVAKTVKVKGAQSVDCSVLKNDALVAEIKKVCEQSPSIEIEPAAITELSQRTQGSMSRIACEIVKLKSYCNGVITRRDVCEMVTADFEFQVYDLTQAVSDKNAEKAFRALDVFYNDGVRPMRIINQLYDRYRKMLLAELNKGMGNDELGALLGVKGAAVYFIKKSSSAYSQVRLKKCVDCLHSLQCAVLSGKRTENSALQQAMFELLGI